MDRGSADTTVVQYGVGPRLAENFFSMQVARLGLNRSGHISGSSTRRESAQPATGRLGVVDIILSRPEHRVRDVKFNTLSFCVN